MSHKILDMSYEAQDEGQSDEALYKVSVFESKRDGLWYWNAKLPSGENIAHDGGFRTEDDARDRCDLIFNQLAPIPIKTTKDPN